MTARRLKNLRLLGIGGLFSFVGLVPLLLGAETIPLQSPVDCVLGETCFLQQYVDNDPGPGATDLRCAPRSYDGHKGTDFRLPDRAAMEVGVDIFASAAGVVRAVRDGLADISQQTDGAPAVAGQECGNGVLIDHPDGWSTQYCHLKQGSVSVEPGAKVAVGTVLGQIGLSGKTTFPHLHLTLRRGDEVIDPFGGSRMGAACSLPDTPLWAESANVVYSPGGFLSAGMTDGVPSFDDVKRISPHSPEYTRATPALVFWVHTFGVEQGDVIATRLTAPDGQTVAEERYEMPRNRATQFRAIGRKRPGRSWPAGTYEGSSELIRNGKVIDRKSSETILR